MRRSTCSRPAARSSIAPARSKRRKASSRSRSCSARGAPIKRVPVDPAEIGGLKECISAEGDVRTLPCHLAELDGLDGFFAARLVRN